MPRLRHIQSGAVVSVTAEKAARLGSEWTPIETHSSAEKQARRRRNKTN